MKILKFGGKSLSNGTGLKNVISIIENKIRDKQQIAVVLSARANATDELEQMLEKARLGINYEQDWINFKNYQTEPAPECNLDDIFELLLKKFEGVSLTEDYSLKLKDLVLAQGELIAVRVLTHICNKIGFNAVAIDSRKFFITDSKYSDANILEEISAKKTIDYFQNLADERLLFVTGFIASNESGDTTTLGRNGSNYSASLLAKFVKAEEIQSYTNVSGIYTANPDQVHDAQIIKQLTYQEANELASFGATILHGKTILPLLENKIPLRILNTFEPDHHGTLICEGTNINEVKSISVQKNICIVNIEGKGLLGKRGIDARIFDTLNKNNINIGVISQGSSERSVGFVINSEDAETAISTLKKEFDPEIKKKDISSIYPILDISIVSVIGQNMNGFSASYQALTKNNINILLINNTINGNNISLAIENHQVSKAVNVIHSQIFGVAKNINIAIFGKGTVGGALINQILSSQNKILKRKETKLNIFAIAESKKILLNKRGIEPDWLEQIQNYGIENTSVNQIIEFAENNHLENLIAIDNTANPEFIKNYIPLIENGFDLISSNKIANTADFKFYKQLRNTLKTFNKQYLYETNVGAGLPLIDTIKLLHDSGENITRIRGVFSGSLSYIFNKYSINDISFSEILMEAVNKGYTEPDPREDLCGNDVARKLLILARELDLENEFDDIQITNLIPEKLRNIETKEFLNQINELDSYFENMKNDQQQDYVLRYTGDLFGDLQKDKGELKVDLVSVPKSSSLGQLSGADSIFEIYTESYGDNPIVIQGAGAGAQVTARGVFGDLLRIAEKK